MTTPAIRKFFNLVLAASLVIGLLLAGLPPQAVQAESDVPDGLTAGEWQGIRQAVAAAEYHFAYHVADDDVPAPYYWAPNRAQGWQTRFTPTGAQVTPVSGEDWSWQLSLVGYGREGAMQTVDMPDLTASRDTLTYQWDTNLNEWWVNSPAGLEQGFTLQHKPAGNTAPLIVEMNIEGNLTAVSTNTGMAFKDNRGDTTLTYDHLQVTDAAGQTIPAQLELTNADTLRIVVQDANAAYPLTIDPWMQTAQLTLVTGDPPDDRLGASVAISGDVIVVGAYAYAGGQTLSGAAYVFVKPTSGGWVDATQTAKLTASDAAVSDYFGRAVAISGDTIAINASLQNDGYTGAVYVFVKPTSGGWVDTTEDAKFTPSVPNSQSLGNHHALAINANADTIVAGSTSEGAIYVFAEPSSGSWAACPVSADCHETAKLTVSTSDPDYADNQLGVSVAIDGDTVVAGAILPNTSYQGAAYVFEKPGSGGWVDATETAKLTAATRTASDYFGWSVAINSSHIFVGALEAGGAGLGRVDVFTEPGGGWTGTINTPVAALTASDGAAGNYFGVKLAVSGDTLVAAPYTVISHTDTTYVFVEPGSGWATATENAILTASDGAADDDFGGAVAISGDTIVVGAPGDDADYGAAYVYEKPGSGWTTATQTAKLTHTNNENGALSGAYFGWSVAVSGDTVVVGAREFGVTDGKGAAYVFVRPAGGWIDTSAYAAKLAASDGVADDDFGWSAAISGNTVVIGATEHNSAQGAAYVFARPAGGWQDATETVKLTAGSDSANNDKFGYAVAISGDTIVVGSHYLNGSPAGAAYVFVRPETGWADAVGYTARLTTTDDTITSFGYSVAISGDTVVVGAPYTQNAAYVFTRPAGGWTTTSAYTAKLVHPAPVDSNDHFGNAVAISGDTIAVGAYGDDYSLGNEGSVYIFTAPWGNPPAATLTASTPVASASLGLSVAISGDTVAASASGEPATYVFVKPPGGWTNATETARFGVGGSSWNAVAIAGDTVVVGDHSYDSSRGTAYIFQNEFCSKTSGDWGSASTWVGGAVPGSTDDACISTGDTVTLAGGASANRVLVNPFAALDLDTQTLTVEDSLTNNGTISQTQTVDGANVEFLHIQNAAVDTTKYRGLVIDTSSSAANLGMVHVGIRETFDWFGWYDSNGVDTTQFCTNNSDDVYAERCYTINPDTDGEANLRLYARTADELNGIPESNLTVYRNFPHNTDTWVALTSTNGNDGGDYSYGEATTPGFSKFLLGEAGNAPTAISLQSISANTSTPFLVLISLLILVFSGILIWRRRVS